MAAVNMARERSLYNQNARQSAPRLQRDISQLREQMSTGKRVNRPSDDPGAYEVAEQMRRLGNTYTRHEESIAAARPWVDHTQETLDQLGELFTQAQEEGLRAANDVRSDEDRESIAQRLESLKGEVVDQLNAKYDGEYLFAGNKTTTKPFADDGQPANPDTDPPGVDGDSIDKYEGIDGERIRSIGPGRTLKVNVMGEELHEMSGDRTITGTLDELITAVRSGDVTDMQTALGNVEDARDHVIDKGAKAGDISRRLTAAKEQLEAAGLNAEERRSQAEDTDYLETVTALQQKQTSLQAALKATADTLQTSLMDFLR